MLGCRLAAPERLIPVRKRQSDCFAKSTVSPVLSLEESAMPRYLLLVVGCVCLGLAQPVPRNDCKPVKRYGVHGCDPARNGSCPKGYDWIGVCPPNPMMKAPCVLMCVPHRQEEKKGKASLKAQSPRRVQSRFINNCQLSGGACAITSV